jgi:hypothetical protein
MVPQDIHYSCWYVSNLGHSLLTTRQRYGRSLAAGMAVGSVEKDVGGHHPFMACHALVWIGTLTIQLVSRGRQCGCTIF